MTSSVAYPVDLKQLQYFVQVAELGSFTRAASVLRVAQPALSRQVRSLEVELRQSLFDRNGRGVTLTPAGARLLAHGRGILQQVERARLDLEDQRGAATGLLSVGLPPSVSRTLTAPLVEVFRARFPKATLSVVEGLSTYTLEWLTQGRIDCAVVYNATPAAAIDLLPVLQEPLFLVSARQPQAKALSPTQAIQAIQAIQATQATHVSQVTQSHQATQAPHAPAPVRGPTLTLAQLATKELVIPSRPHAIRMRLETVMAEAGCKLHVGLEIESVPAMLDLVQRHALYAVLSLNAVRASGQLQAFVVQPITVGKRQQLSASLWLATSALRPRGPLLDQATQVLVSLLQQALVPKR